MALAVADPAEFYDSDIAFHLAVFAGCHILLIQRLSGIVEIVLTLRFRLQRLGLADLQEAVEAHGRAIDRIRVRHRAGPGPSAPCAPSSAAPKSRSAAAAAESRWQDAMPRDVGSGRGYNK